METRNQSNGTVGCEYSMPPGSICSVQKPHSTILTSNTAAKPVVSSRQVSQIGETYAYFQLQAANQPYMCLPPCTGSHGATVHSPGMAKVSNYWECEYLYSCTPIQPHPSHPRLSNKKPSRHAFSALSQQGVHQNDVTATLGLSTEPLSKIQSQTQTLPSALTEPGANMMRDSTALAERIVKHFFNHVSGRTDLGCLRTSWFR